SACPSTAGIPFALWSASLPSHTSPSHGRGTLLIVRCFASAPKAKFAPIAGPPMTSHHSDRAEAPYWTLPGLAEGAWRSAALLPGAAIFGLAFGTVAAQKGLSLADR